MPVLKTDAAGGIKVGRSGTGFHFDSSPSIEFNVKLEPFFSTSIHRAVIKLWTDLTIKISMRAGLAEFVGAVGALLDKISRKRGKLLLSIEQERAPPE